MNNALAILGLVLIVVGVLWLLSGALVGGLVLVGVGILLGGSSVPRLRR
jgi:hypothetical protein